MAVGWGGKIPPCKVSEVLSPRLTSILLCKAPSNDPEWCAWDELFIREGQADGPDSVCQEWRGRSYIRVGFFIFYILCFYVLGVLLVC